VSEEHVFVFSSFVFVPRQQVLLREGQPVKLGCRAMDILHLLLKSAGEPVSKRALQKFAWPDTFVHESNLKVHIHSLRRALGETSPQPTYIGTVAGRGYRFIPPVSIEPIGPAQPLREVPPLVHSLPGQRTLIGRDDEVDRVGSLLAERRLVTLVGPGGVGKTAVAVAVAHQVRRRFPDGIYFLDLSVTNDLSVVPNILAAVCGIRGHPADIVAAVANYLEHRRVLILIDSCEHVLPAVASIVTRFQEARVAACVLATSLEPLRLHTETVQLIQPLEYPPTLLVPALSDALRYSAIELFATRASEWTDYTLTDGDTAVVARLCEKLGGLPLAIEIAATKLDQYSPASLLDSLGQRFSLLKNEDPVAHRRHRTLWATLDWSYQLLSASETRIFRLLSLFSGAFAHEDVATMAQVVGADAYQTTVALGGLVAKSLVAAEVDEDSLRYRLLDVTRIYAAERLRQEPIAHEAARHFARFMLTVVKKFGQERASRFLAVGEIAQYKRRLNDLREALSWCFGVGDDPALGIDLTIAAIPLWNEFSLVGEQQSQVERALEHSASSLCSSDHRAPLAVSRAWSLTHRRMSDAAKDAWLLAVDVAEHASDVNQRLRALWGRSVYLLVAGKYREALDCLREYRDVALLHENGVALPDGERLCAMAEVYLGELTAARDKLERLARALTNGEPRSRVPRFQVEPYVVVQNNLVLVTWLLGCPDRAAVMVMETVDHIGRAGHTQAQSHVLATAAILTAIWNGDSESFERYIALLGANLTADITAWQWGYHFFRALSRHARGERDASVDMRSAVDAVLSSGFLMNVPMYLSMLADAQLKNGAVDEAERTVEEALLVQAQTGERYSFPDLLRIKAKVLAARGRQDLAETVLHQALSECVEMTALSLQLRVACDLAELWIAQGREPQAFELLAPIYGAFSEGHANKDLVRASALLASTKGMARDRPDSLWSR
jgi:predicted ATPase/DNA-binding winged helix-turn-helix (wHTH) protein